jgi:16S rRNA (guanine527-N7)-methyltransferase
MNDAWKNALLVEARAVGVELEPSVVDRLATHVDLLLKWNAKVNLTRITQPDEVRIKHVIDSLSALPLVPSQAVDVLDMGAGAGFPGVPWMCARPTLKVTSVDSVQKKVAFLKTVLAQLRLNGRAIQVHLNGQPESEGVGLSDVVVSRAFMELEALLPLARRYLRPEGCVLAMLGPRENADQIDQIAGRAGFSLDSRKELVLPQSMGQRLLLRLVPRGTPTG